MPYFNKMFTWKILEIKVEGDKITSAKYFVSATDGQNIVETEGNHTFLGDTGTTPFDQVEHDQVVDWIKKETIENDQNSIELRLQKQLEVLKNQKSVTPPWVKPTFKPTL